MNGVSWSKPSSMRHLSHGLSNVDRSPTSIDYKLDTSYNEMFYVKLIDKIKLFQNW